jgi:hypothetical protein
LLTEDLGNCTHSNADYDDLTNIVHRFKIANLAALLPNEDRQRNHIYSFRGEITRVRKVNVLGLRQLVKEDHSLLRKVWVQIAPLRIRI